MGWWSGYCSLVAVNASFLFWWVPAPIGGFLSDLLTASWGKRFGTGMTAFQPALPAQLNCSLVFVLVYRRCRRAILDLARENITNQFAKLNGIAGSFKALCCHGCSMPWFASWLKPDRIQTVPLPIVGCFRHFSMRLSY